MEEKRKYVVESGLVYFAETRRYFGTLATVEAEGIDITETVVSPWVISREPKPPPAAAPATTDGLAPDAYSGLTMPVLKKMLDGADVSYPKKARHADLVKLARSEIG